MPKDAELQKLPIVITPLVGENAPDTLLLQFFFTNEELLPGGIPLKERRLSAAAQKIVRKQAGIEPGEQVVKNLPDVTVADLWQSLPALGLPLIDAHYFVERNRRNGKGLPAKDRFIVKMSFAKPSEDQTPMCFSRETKDALAELLRLTWGFAHVNVNPSRVDSVILLNLKPNMSARHTIIARDETLQAV